MRGQLDDLQAQMLEGDGQPKARAGAKPREGITKQEVEEHVANSEAVFEAMHRINKCERTVIELRNLLSPLQRKFDDSSRSSVTLPGLSKRVEDVTAQLALFERRMDAEISSVKHSETSHVVRAFQQRWGPRHVAFSLRILVCAWLEFVDQRRRVRNALRATKQLYSRHHAASRIRSWWYAAQRDLHEQGQSHTEELSASLSAQVEEFKAIVQRRERASVELSRDFNGRLGQLERKVEAQGGQKADQSTVVEMVDRVERRLENDVNPERLNRVETEFRDDIKELQAELSKAGDVARCTERVAAVDDALRQGLKRLGEDMRARATIEDVATKADAQVVERAMVTLAKQSDQIVCMVGADLERFRCALVRLLELSPDVQRAALTLGVAPAPGGCLWANRPELSEQGLLGGMVGSDGERYRQCPDGAQAAEEQLQRISEELQLPTKLRAGIGAGAGPASLLDREPGCLADGRSASLFRRSRTGDRPAAALGALFPSSARAHETRSTAAAAPEEALSVELSREGGRRRPLSSVRPRSGTTGPLRTSSAGRPQSSARALCH